MKKTMILSLLVVGLFSSCEERVVPMVDFSSTPKKVEEKPVDQVNAEREAERQWREKLLAEVRVEMEKTRLAEEAAEKKRIHDEIMREVEIARIAREQKMAEIEQRAQEEGRRSLEKMFQDAERERQRQHELEMIREANRGYYYR